MQTEIRLVWVKKSKFCIKRILFIFCSSCLFFKGYYQKKITETITKAGSLEPRDLNEAIHLIKTDDEIDFVKNALAYYHETIAKNKERTSQDNTSINFLNVLIMLKKTKKILEIFNKKVSVRQFYLKRTF